MAATKTSGDLVAQVTKESNVIRGGGLFRKTRELSVYRLGDHSFELHQYEVVICGEEFREKVVPFRTFHALYEWVGRAYSPEVADALIDSMLRQ